MTFMTRTLPVLAGLTTCTLAFGDAPPNDSCAGAIAIDVDSTTQGSNAEATNEAEAPPSGVCQLYSDTNMQSSVWYTTTVPDAGRLVLSTCNNASFDTRLFVFTSRDITSMIACNDDGTGCSGYSSHLEVDFAEATTVWIALGGYNGAQGTFAMTSEFIGDTSPPDNDSCENAIPISLDSAVVGSNQFASNTDGTPASDVCNLYSDCCIQSSVWYSVTLDYPRLLDISTCNAANFDTRLFVLTECGNIDSMVACNDEAGGCAGNSSRVLMDADPGTYYIAVAGYNGVQGDFELTVGEIVCTPVEAAFDFPGYFTARSGNATMRSFGDDETWCTWATDTINGHEATVLEMTAGHTNAQSIAVEYDACASPFGAAFLNNFTIIMDIRVDGGEWVALWNANDGDPTNYNDAECFINNLGQFWLVDNGSTGPVVIEPDTWYRIAMVEDQATATHTIYVDGVVVVEAAAGSIDATRSLWAHRMMLFSDNNQETGGGAISSAVFADYAYTVEQIEALGGPTAAGIGLDDEAECAGDINGNGEVDGADLTMLLGAWGTDDADSDLNGDGNVDGADLTMILGAWGTC